MRQVVMAYYGTAYLMVSKMHYGEPLLKSEVEKLPTLQQYMKKKLSGKQKLESYQDLQIFGWVLLKEVFKNITSDEFKKMVKCQVLTPNLELSIS